MKERPILFSGEMVRALLSDNKTQTRRVTKPQPLDVLAECTKGSQRCSECNNFACGDNTYAVAAIGRCLYGVPGDRLWVREMFQPIWTHYDTPGDWDTGEGYDINYIATSERVEWADQADFCGVREITDRGMPSIYMPRWASRIRLEITDVRVERVQEISEEDAAAEGIKQPRCPDCGYTQLHCREHLDHHLCPRNDPASVVSVFHALWNSLNAKRGYGWDVNPWVWAISFKRINS